MCGKLEVPYHTEGEHESQMCCDSPHHNNSTTAMGSGGGISIVNFDPQSSSFSPSDQVGEAVRKI